MTEKTLLRLVCHSPVAQALACALLRRRPPAKAGATQAATRKSAVSSSSGLSPNGEKIDSLGLSNERTMPATSVTAVSLEMSRRKTLHGHS
jgi:hypothetical protein